MIFFKDGIGFSSLQPQAVLAMVICDQVMDEYHHNLTITSVCEGVHKDGSLHYAGKAFDVRIRDLGGILPLDVARTFRARLGSQYQVVLEADHIHVEYDFEKA